MELTPLLRERCFGEFEGGSNAHYAQVWEADALDAAHTQWHVESVEAVARRMLCLLEQLEDRSRNAQIVLVSHGDPLQVLECWFREQSLRQHRQLTPLAPGELRKLN